MTPSLEAEPDLQTLGPHKQVSCGGFVIQAHEKFKLCRNQWLITLDQNETQHMLYDFWSSWLKVISIVIYVIAQHIKPF